MTDSPPNLPCSLSFRLIPLILSPHGVCFSFSRMLISTVQLPSIHLLCLNYSLPWFSCSQPLCLPQRRCRIVQDGWSDSVCRGKEGGKYSRAECFQSLFLLQPPLMDGSNGRYLNVALFSGSKHFKSIFIQS